jgi:hypothetical protein
MNIQKVCQLPNSCTTFLSFQVPIMFNRLHFHNMPVIRKLVAKVIFYLFKNALLRITLNHLVKSQEVNIFLAEVVK